MQRFYEQLAPFLYLKGAGAPATAAVPVKEVADVAARAAGSPQLVFGRFEVLA